jgi:hypothetical protein
VSERVAILVVHGIGEEQPYETLDQFTRGLLNELEFGKPWTIEPLMSQESDPTRPGHLYPRVGYKISPPSNTSVTFRSETPCLGSPGHAHDNGEETISEYREISLFEYYWSPITKNKIKYTTSLLFLIEAGLQPFRYFASNIAAIYTAGKPSNNPASDPADGPVRIILREILRQSFLFLPIIVFLLYLLYLLWRAGSLITTGGVLSKAANLGPLVATALIAAIRSLYIYSNSRALLRSPWRDADISAKRWWKCLLAIGIVFHVVFWPYGLRPTLHGVATLGSYAVQSSCDLRHVVDAHGWHSAMRVYADDYLSADHVNFTADAKTNALLIRLTEFLFVSPNLVPYLKIGILLLLAWFIRSILINYIGDIAVYANANQLSENYAARAQIVEGCTAALSGILQQMDLGADGSSRPRFDRVLVAGHSLGSVIAYDCLNGVINLARTGQGITHSHLQRIRGLVTFGSPLNKIYYFFRELDNPSATLRHRTLDLIHGFRIKPSLATNLPPIFTDVPAWASFDRALRQGFTWINAYSLADPVSGRLLFYDVGREDPKRPGVFISDDAQQRFELGLFGFAHVGYWRSREFYRFVIKNLL